MVQNESQDLSTRRFAERGQGPSATIAAELGRASPDAACIRCARLKPRVGVLLQQLRRGSVPLDESGIG